MTQTKHLAARLCGLASVLAGMVWTGGTLYNLAAGGSIEPPNTFGAVIALAATSLMVFAFIGIYAGLSENAGTLSLLGAGLGIVGGTLLSGVNSVALAKSVGAVEVTRPPIEIGAPGVLALILAVLLLGVEAIRDERYSKWAGAALILGAALLPLRAVDPNLWALAILSASLGFVWLGWKVWSASEGQQKQTGAARATSAAVSS